MAPWQALLLAALIATLFVWSSVLSIKLRHTNARLKKLAAVQIQAHPVPQTAQSVARPSRQHDASQSADAPDSPRPTYLTMRDLRAQSRTPSAVAIGSGNGRLPPKRAEPRMPVTQRKTAAAAARPPTRFARETLEIPAYLKATDPAPAATSASCASSSTLLVPNDDIPATAAMDVAAPVVNIEPERTLALAPEASNDAVAIASEEPDIAAADAKSDDTRSAAAPGAPAPATASDAASAPSAEKKKQAEFLLLSIQRRRRRTRSGY